MRDYSGDWTSFSDIGKLFNGVALLLDEYLQTERRYIYAVQCILNSGLQREIQVQKVEKYTPENLSGDLLELYHVIQEGGMFPMDALSGLMQLVLREYVWYEIHVIGAAELCVRFGYDYYMYVNGVAQEDTIWEEVRKIGLFVR
ncbi:hypothetical protein HHL17_09830 [Chitinophaga sp. G-6-1-13]|uniref:Uncharacterized protein n=1 Tax=Chitinophaga fulva TaxID=2728842 RepID=A0A848GNH7_9BACT|nr:hypothetical protein [Chitinophaga fulva]NML37488.1 hypothetical protein [Chitinophaga fulva]